MELDRTEKTLRIMESEGLPMSTAMREAGFSEAYSHNPHEFARTAKFKALLEERLPDELLTRVHLDGLEATRIDFAGDEVADYATRHKYLDTAYKLKRAYPLFEGMGNNIQNNVFVMPSEILEKNDINTVSESNSEGSASV